MPIGMDLYSTLGIEIREFIELCTRSEMKTAIISFETEVFLLEHFAQRFWRAKRRLFDDRWSYKNGLPITAMYFFRRLNFHVISQD
jgi:hypothetical protein